jgi:DNA repair exonuclease SbcCD nuclease subunit
MKTILIPDTHIDFHKGNSDFYHEAFRKIIYDKVVPLMFDKGADTIIFLGDIFESRTSPDMKSVLFIKNLLDSFLSQYKEFSIIMITGNHDVYYKNTNKVNSLHIFNDMFNSDRITIVDEPLEKDNILFVPWITEDNRENIMDMVKNTKMEYCIGHFEFGGFKQHPNDTYLSKGISTTEFKHFKNVISGHIHYGSTIGNIVYLGCLIQHKKDDRNDSKKIGFLDTVNHVLEQHHHGVNTMVDITIDNDFQLVDCFNKKVYVKVALGVDDKTVESCLEMIREMKPLSVIIYENENKIKRDIDLQYSMDAPQKSVIDIIQDYSKKIEVNGINNEIVYRYLLHYYEKSSSMTK